MIDIDFLPRSNVKSDFYHWDHKNINPSEETRLAYAVTVVTFYFNILLGKKKHNLIYRIDAKKANFL